MSYIQNNSFSNYGSSRIRPSFYQNNGPGFQGTLPDANVGGFKLGWRSGPFGGPLFGGPRLERNKGYALDLNRNGRYDRGQDGVLAFDMNRDGKIDKKDIHSTNQMMKAATGNYDLNGDGRTSFGERIRGNRLRHQYARLDSNRDGTLSAHEMHRGGGKVWIDSSRGGGVGRNELHSVFNLPNSRGWGPSQRLDGVNPFTRTSHTSNNWGGGQWGGGGWGGGNCNCWGGHHGRYY